MTRKTRLTPDVLAALAAADRSPGWNKRTRDVQRFTVGACALTSSHTGAGLIDGRNSKWQHGGVRMSARRAHDAT